MRRGKIPFPAALTDQHYRRRMPFRRVCRHRRSPGSTERLLAGRGSKRRRHAGTKGSGGGAARRRLRRCPSSARRAGAGAHGPRCRGHSPPGMRPDSRPARGSGSPQGALPFPSLPHRPPTARLLGGGTAAAGGAAPTNAPGRRRCSPAAAAGPEAPKVWPRLPGPGGTGRGDSGDPGRPGTRARSR